MVSPPDCPNAPGTAFIMANRWLPMHTDNEPNCNESSLDLPAIKVRPRASRNSAKDRAMSWMADGVGRLLAHYLEKPAQGYEPFTPSDPETLRATLMPVS